MSVLPSGNDRSSQESNRGSVDVRALRSHGLTSIEIQNAIRFVDDGRFANQATELADARSRGARILAGRFRAAQQFRREVGERLWLRL